MLIILVNMKIPYSADTEQNVKNKCQVFMAGVKSKVHTCTYEPSDPSSQRLNLFA